jgi:molecular chaperone GrpE
MKKKDFMTETETEYASEGSEDETLSALDEAVIEALRAEVVSLKEQALRYAAEAENTRRRAEREINDSRAYAITKFAKDLLGVADNLARALEHVPQDAEDPLVRNLAVGLEMTQKELHTAFERNSLKRVDPAPGEKFDPHRHQAVMEQTSSEVVAGGVIQVLQTGYDLFGRIVRPAMVIVAARDSTGVAAGASQASDTEAAGAAFDA